MHCSVTYIINDYKVCESLMLNCTVTNKDFKRVSLYLSVSLTLIEEQKRQELNVGLWVKSPGSARHPLARGTSATQ